jgi:hypothetical protein
MRHTRREGSRVKRKTGIEGSREEEKGSRDQGVEGSRVRRKTGIKGSRK